MSTLVMWFTLAVQVLLLVTAAVLVLLVQIDAEFEARLSIEVNCRRTLLRHVSVFDFDEQQ